MLKHNCTYVLIQSKSEPFIPIFQTHCNNLHFPFLYFDSIFFKQANPNLFHLEMDKPQSPPSFLQVVVPFEVSISSSTSIMHFQEKEYKHLKHANTTFILPLPFFIFNSTIWNLKHLEYKNKNLHSKEQRYEICIFFISYGKF